MCRNIRLWGDPTVPLIFVRFSPMWLCRGLVQEVGEGDKEKLQKTGELLIGLSEISEINIHRIFAPLVSLINTDETYRRSISWKMQQKPGCLKSAACCLLQLPSFKGPRSYRYILILCFTSKATEVGGQMEEVQKQSDRSIDIQIWEIPKNLIQRNKYDTYPFKFYNA